VRLAVRYTVFACAATLVNLVTQWVSFRLYQGPVELMVGIAAGTATGLISKYSLDKIWIFEDHSYGIADNIHKFGFYSLTGISTTAIFWATELLFAQLSDEFMRYFGAAIGLATGYVLKYHLDRHFVFRVRS